MKWPSIQSVANDLMGFKETLHREDGYVDCRLQVKEDGSWSLKYGDPQFDLDHTGFWGSGSVGARSNCRELAYDLLEQCKDAHDEWKSLGDTQVIDMGGES